MMRARCWDLVQGISTSLRRLSPHSLANDCCLSPHPTGSHCRRTPLGGILSCMSTQSQLSEISRLLRNLIRTGVVSEVDTDGALCRVQTGEIQTGWINWLARRAGRSRDWWAPSVGSRCYCWPLAASSIPPLS